ncbi:glycosyltransferase family 4 protein [Parapedobacter koreensis]|uniref:Glycosyl transferases group 1 n=1 Tax=Parapedobacter koreensis TaxID=332977 RepID=A0A1H7NNI0_9SPHI|nr:glycosyltransferase family 4 protein [Parapedobacter koreensis]SEL24931.1 Glycosyl transferases group 1 [Parapedobacter koreensis]
MKTNPKILLAHPTGNANVRALAIALAAEDFLHKFYTSIAVYKGDIWHQLSRLPGFSALKKRSFDNELESLTRTHPYREVGRLLAQHFNTKHLTKHEKGIFSIDKVYHSLDNYVSSHLSHELKYGLRAAYAYEDGALQTFKTAKKLGLKCVYDLPIAYWKTGRKIMEDEAYRNPKWAHTLKGGIKDSESKLQRKTNELELADIVIVPSKFVYDSLPTNLSEKKIVLSPFGSPTLSDPLTKGEKKSNKPLKILFVGSLTQRKGLSDLFEAVKMLKTKNVELVVMGSLADEISFYKSELKDFIYIPPGSHDEVLRLMASCDIFCLPSVVEGRALVIQEAMSRGLPIIITPNTGAEDLIVENKTGFLVPIRSPEKIAEKIDWFLSNRQIIGEMSHLAHEHASKYTWENYSNIIINAISNELSSQIS